MKRILVTGGAGFIGSNLCKRLMRDENNYVLCLDNLYTGRRVNIRELLPLPNFKFIFHDVREVIDIDADEIYNAACPASPAAYQKSPTKTTLTAMAGLHHMLELAKRYDAKLLQFSTSEVYGEPQMHPQREAYWGNVNPIGIRSCYDEAKRCGESLCMDYWREYGTRIKIVRIFNTYGPKMDANDGRVVSNFIVQALHNEPITIYGTGKQTRSFCYVDDLIEGLICMMATDDSVRGPINLGNPGEFSMLELAEMVKRITGSKSEIHFEPLPQDDPTQRKPDISRAKALLGWEPGVMLEDGIRRTAEYFGGKQ